MSSGQMGWLNRQVIVPRGREGEREVQEKRHAGRKRAPLIVIMLGGDTKRVFNLRTYFW